MKALLKGLVGLVLMAASAFAGDMLAGDSDLIQNEAIVGTACTCGTNQVTVSWDGGGFTGTWNPSNGRYENGDDYIEFFYPTDPPSTTGAYESNTPVGNGDVSLQ